MRYLKSINERLYFSPSFRDALIHLAEDYQDKVACLFLELRKNDIYDTDEDFNFVELTTQFKMLSFIPYKKRVSDDDEEDNYDVSKSTPIKMGRLAKSIVEKTKNYFTITIEPEDVKIITGGFSNSTHILIKGYQNLLHSRYIDAKFAVVYDDKKYEADFVNVFYHTNVTAFGSEGTRISIKNYEGPIDNSKIESGKIKLIYDSGFMIGDKDIEKFVDRLSALLKDSSSSAQSKMKLVDGENIRHWYDQSNYASLIGELGNSCMADESCQPYFDIYCKNDVSLLILLNENNKLIGRALVWKLTTGEYFMDRVYTIISSDRYLFYTYAKQNNWAYKEIELGKVSIFFNGKKYEPNNITLKVQLDEWKFKYYPYLDTLYYLDVDTGIISNDFSRSRNEIWKLTQTQGDCVVL